MEPSLPLHFRALSLHCPVFSSTANLPALKWNTQGSQESRLDGVLLWQTGGMFPYSGHRCERLRLTGEGMFPSDRHRREDVLLKQAHERTRDEGDFAHNMHVLVRLTLHTRAVFVTAP